MDNECLVDSMAKLEEKKRRSERCWLESSSPQAPSASDSDKKNITIESESYLTMKNRARGKSR
jgi:hypothetical protein